MHDIFFIKVIVLVIGEKLTVCNSIQSTSTLMTMIPQDVFVKIFFCVQFIRKLRDWVCLIFGVHYSCASRITTLWEITSMAPERLSLERPVFGGISCFYAQNLFESNIPVQRIPSTSCPE